MENIKKGRIISILLVCTFIFAISTVSNFVAAFSEGDSLCSTINPYLSFGSRLSFPYHDWAIYYSYREPIPNQGRWEQLQPEQWVFKVNNQIVKNKLVIGINCYDSLEYEMYIVGQDGFMLRNKSVKICNYTFCVDGNGVAVQAVQCEAKPLVQKYPFVGWMLDLKLDTENRE